MNALDNTMPSSEDPLPNMYDKYTPSDLQRDVVTMIISGNFDLFEADRPPVPKKLLENWANKYEVFGWSVKGNIDKINRSILSKVGTRECRWKEAGVLKVEEVGVFSFCIHNNVLFTVRFTTEEGVPAVAENFNAGLIGMFKKKEHE